MTQTTFTGLRNVQRPERLPPGALAEAVNLFVDDTGGLETLPGFTGEAAEGGEIGEVAIGSGFVIGTGPAVKGISGTAALNRNTGTIGKMVIGKSFKIGWHYRGFTDAWEMDHLKYGFLVFNGGIYRRDASGQTVRVYQGLSDDVLQWASVGNLAFYAGDDDAGWIVDGIQHRPLRLPMPNQPVISIERGPLKAGMYQVTQCFQHVESGLESPLSPSLNVEVPEGVAILVHPEPPEGYRSKVYVTAVNHTVEKLLGVSDGGVLKYAGQALGELTDKRQINTYPLPALPVAGLAWWEEKLFAAFHDKTTDISTVYFSQRQAYGCFDLEQDAFAVPGEVVQMLGVPEGVLVATDRSIKLVTVEGHFASINPVANYGCKPGRPFGKDQWGDVMVATVRGAAVWNGSGLVSSHLKHSWDLKDTAHVALINIHGVSLGVVLTQDGGDRYNAY